MYKNNNGKNNNNGFVTIATSKDQKGCVCFSIIGDDYEAVLEKAKYAFNFPENSDMDLWYDAKRITQENYKAMIEKVLKNMGTLLLFPRLSSDVHKKTPIPSQNKLF